MTTAAQRIETEVTSWPGVRAADGSRGERSFTVGKREIGHLHGSRSAHFAFPRDVAGDLRAQGRIGPHPVFPDHPKLAARAITSDDDVADVIALLRSNYERIAPTAAVRR